MNDNLKEIIKKLKPKDIIKCDTDFGKTHLLIVGDVNNIGGSCDHCSILHEFKSIEIVGKVYTIEDLKKMEKEFKEKWILEYPSESFFDNFFNYIERQV